jgi:exodeoxyribonuclease VII large subunit
MDYDYGAMSQLGLFSSSESMPFTVSQLMARIRSTVEADPMLSDLRVEGEVSNFSQASSGHCYFTLKDSGAELRCVMWRNVAQAVALLPTDGDMVLVYGSVGVYEQRGTVQLYVDHVEPAGVGALYQQFEQLKTRLEAEGLFALERKRPLPSYPAVIGIVTSPNAAALQDILNVLTRRYPVAEVLLSPTPVQGELAPPQIVEALNALGEREDVDVILVARGGGSLEDLWAFNDERVARAVAGSRVPVVCGVGHETDFSLADFAADQRAPTPSAAAEIATPDSAELFAQIIFYARRAAGAFETVVKEHRWRLAESTSMLKHLSPATRLVQVRQRVDDLTMRGLDSVEHELELWRERLLGYRGRLENVSPLATLERGYAVVWRRADDRVVTSVKDARSGDGLSVRVSDGDFDATVD